MNARSATLILGGAGFIGANLADRLLREGREVIVFDDLSRRGVERNLDWLAEHHASRLTVRIGDIRQAAQVADVVAEAGEVYHFAAQVAVTSSLQDPARDFAINACGTLNVLEALRRLDDPPPLVFTSTNKVYGALEDIALTATDRRYVPADSMVRECGVNEHRPLDFYSPYGCSKGTADQYVLDYSRCFGLRTIVFRMSCIYGPHQQGNEDQGWVAHLMMRARAGAPLTLFGDGLQVRDILYVDDLVDALRLAVRNSEALAGRVFNIGGGPANTLSLLELVSVLRNQMRWPVRVEHAAARVGDQRYYVSDTTAFTQATGWQPRTPVAEGLDRLNAWLTESSEIPARPVAVAQ